MLYLPPSPCADDKGIKFVFTGCVHHTSSYPSRFGGLLNFEVRRGADAVGVDATVAGKAAPTVGKAHFCGLVQ